MRRVLFFVVLLALMLTGCVIVRGGRADAFPGGPWSKPVSGPVVRGFDPPATRFGPGHLGVDFGVPLGTPVRAAGDGVVVFAGRVGAGLHVVVLHAGDVRTTDSFLASIVVVRGQRVERGDVVGTSGGTGPQHTADVLHFGVRVGSEYIDPMLLFAPPDLGKVVHLAEPHGGTFAGSAGSSRPAPASTSEMAPIASEIRVDARPPVRAPSWWPTATSGTTATAASGTTATPPPRARAASRRSERRAPPPVDAAMGAAVPAAGFVLLRRRRRAYF